MMRRIVSAASLALVAGCGEKAAVSDAVFAQEEAAAFVGAGSDSEISALLLCDHSGASDWPTLTVFVMLPEAGEEIDSSGKDFAVVDGRKVPLRLSLRVDGRAFKLAHLWVQQHEGRKRAILAGGVVEGEQLANAIETAKDVEFAGDGRRFRIRIEGADGRQGVADTCRAAAAASPSTSAASGEQASAPVRTRLSNAEIETAVTSHWKNGRADYEGNGGAHYRIATAVGSPAELPADAQSRGIKMIPGVGLEGDGGPFATVMVAYAVFDDPAAARVYFDDAGFNLGDQEMAELKMFRIERPGYPVVHMRCVFVPDARNSVNCHYKTPDERIVALVLLAEGPPLDFSGNERAIDLVFMNEAAADRASLAASASWAYLYDAVYR